MSTSAISRRYANALVNLGVEQQMVERYGEELSRVSSLLESEDLLRQLLESPTFPMEKKAAILTEVGEKMELGEGMKNFLGLLLEKDRLRYLSQIEGKYREFADERSGLLRTRITAAAELSDEQQKAIGAGLEKMTGKQVALRIDVDPSLIGGIRAEIGGKVFDGSIRTQLNRIEDTLKKG